MKIASAETGKDNQFLECWQNFGVEAVWEVSEAVKVPGKR
jgi:hypothetical protein